MAKKELKFIGIMLTIVMMLSLTLVLVACHKDPPQPTRQEKFDLAAKDLKVSIMSAKNTDWSNSLSNEALAQRKDSSEYLLYESGIDFIIKVLDNAGVAPAQIDALNELFKKEEVINAFKEIDKNTNKNDISKNLLKVLLPLLKDDFTYVDIGNIFYQILYDFSDSAGTIFHQVWARGFDIYNLMEKPDVKLYDVAVVANNISKYFDDSKDGIEREQQLLKDIENAKVEIHTLGEFAYNVVFTSVYDNLLSNIGSDGVLQNITKGEIKETYGSLLDNFRDLKNVLTKDGINKLNVAFENIINSFSGVLLADSIISSENQILKDVVTYVSFAYFSIDLLPTACDVVLTSEELINDESSDFLDQIYLLMTDKEYANEANKYIILAKVLDNAIKVDTNGSTIKEKATSFFNGLFNSIDNIQDRKMRIDKMAGIIASDTMVYLSEILIDNIPESDRNVERANQIITLLTYASYKQFRTNYNSAKAGITIGKDPSVKPYKAAYNAFIKDSFLVNSLGLSYGKIPNQGASEEEYKDYLLGMLAEFDEVNGTTNLLYYVTKSYEEAKCNLISDIDYFIDKINPVIVKLNGFNLVKVGTPQYDQVKAELVKIAIVIE